MRILHVIPYFPPAHSYGGVPEAVYSLAQAQADLGHVTVWTSDAGIQPGIEREGITLEWQTDSYIRAIGQMADMRVIYVRNRWPFLAERFKVFTADYMRAETFSAPIEKFDILHLHESYILGYGRLARWAAGKGVAICHSPHGSLLPPVHRSVKKALHTWIDPLLRRKWFPYISAFFALCTNEREQLLACGAQADSIHIIPHSAPHHSQLLPSRLPSIFVRWTTLQRSCT